MKALVLEVKGHTAAVLKEDGTVVRIRRACTVGETIDLPEDALLRRRGIRRAFYAAAAAAAVLLFAGGFYAYRNVLPYSYVTVDVNPSIEYALNRNASVISVKAVNTDAAPVVEALTESGVKNEPLPEAVSETVDVLYKDGYLGKGDDDTMLVSVASRSDTQAQTLVKTLTETIGTGKDGKLDLQIVTASIADRKNAGGLGISTGRYALIREIKEKEDGTDSVSSGAGVSNADAAAYGSRPVGELVEEARDPAAAAGPSSDSKKETDKENGNENTDGTDQGGTDSTPSAADSGKSGNGDTAAENPQVPKVPEDDTGSKETVPGAASQPAVPQDGKDTQSKPAGDAAQSAPDTAQTPADGGGTEPPDQNDGGTAANENPAAPGSPAVPSGDGQAVPSRGGQTVPSRGSQAAPSQEGQTAPVS
jgi:hypothetical protein